MLFIVRQVGTQVSRVGQKGRFDGNNRFGRQVLKGCVHFLDLGWNGFGTF